MRANPAHGKVYSIHHHMIIIQNGWWFSQGTPVSTTNKTDNHDITEVMLKMALNSITLTPPLVMFVTYTEIYTTH